MKEVAELRATLYQRLGWGPRRAQPHAPPTASRRLSALLAADQSTRLFEAHHQLHMNSSTRWRPRGRMFQFWTSMWHYCAPIVQFQTVSTINFAVFIYGHLSSSVPSAT
jgi:hypothetical protein